MLVSDDVNVFIILLLIIFVVLLGMAIYQWKLRNKIRNSENNDHNLPFVHNSNRKLSLDEKLAIDEYLGFLETQNKEQNKTATSIKSALTPYSDNIYSFNAPITTLITSDEKNPIKRYYINGIEIALDSDWIEYIQDINQVDVVKTQTIPLVIELNGQKLTDYVLTKRQQTQPEPQPQQKSFENRNQENNENVELIRLRKETVEEFNLKHKKRLYDVTPIL